MPAVALTIAGSDPSGGAGLQADLKTFHQHGVYGTAVVTLLTVQNTRRVEAVQPLAPEFIRRQLRAVLEDIPPAAAKSGALGCAAVIREVAAAARELGVPLVVDPVMISKSGAALLEPDAVQVLRRELLPAAYLVTPNVPEAERLGGTRIRGPLDLEAAAVAIANLGPAHVLIKGGHLSGPMVDLLWSNGTVSTLPRERVPTRHTHGTGCVLSAAITARLALGEPLPEAVRGAQAFVHQAILQAPGLGRGAGPLNLHVPPNQPA